LNVDVNISNIPKRAALTPVDGGQRMQQLEEIGARIAAARRTRGWTQGELAAQVGVSRSAVAQWETGRAGQVTANLARIAAVLDVGIEHLMQGPDKRTPSHAVNAEETAMLRLFRACAAADRQILLRTARRLALQE
jgi:transcriptional regulator with XRE-family HTH domain